MKTRIAIILLSTSLYAQNALWIDLSGPWLSHAGEDSPAFADPAFDDRHWTPYELPARAFAPPGYLWLRKTVELPAGAPLDALALTLGPCNYVYEVFVNGMPAGTSGNFAERDYQIPRPRTFPLPAIRVSRITFAIRSLRFPNSPPRIWMGQPTGPFLLTGTTQTPKDAADAYFNRLRVTGTADLVTDHDIYRRHSQIVID